MPSREKILRHRGTPYSKSREDAMVFHRFKVRSLTCTMFYAREERKPDRRGYGRKKPQAPVEHKARHSSLKHAFLQPPHIPISLNPATSRVQWPRVRCGAICRIRRFPILLFRSKRHNIYNRKRGDNSFFQNWRADASFSLLPLARMGHFAPFPLLFNRTR